MKLNQVIATEKGTKTRVYEKLTEAHKSLQKADLFTGHSKTYTPRDDDPTKPTGEPLPPDHRNVVANAEEIVKKTATELTTLFDVNYLRDATNCRATADVTVDGVVILPAVPVTYLLFLEKQLADIHTFVKKLPTLDPAEKWTYDPAQAMYATRPTETARTKKLVRPMVLYEATKEHPAQVKEVTEDVLAGTWSTIKYSTALPAARVFDLLSRVEKLQDAVKVAREKANAIEVGEEGKPGAAVFKFLFG